MIITRTPFRVTLGGGGTDLPSYYSKYGGLIFSFALDKYMFINVNRPVADNFIRVKYSSSEKVAKIENLKHDIARACLEKLDITNNIEISSMADIPAGSGLGSSSSYLTTPPNQMNIGSGITFNGKGKKIYLNNNYKNSTIKLFKSLHKELFDSRESNII